MDARLRELAREAKGFLPEAEGLALYAAALRAAPAGPLLEVGAYCGKSAIYLGAAARDAGSILFSVDHHRGSEENQAGWEHHDPELVDPATGRMDTLPFFRRTVAAADLEDHVVAVVGDSARVSESWKPEALAFLFIDGGHGEEPAMADYRGWAPRLMVGGLLAIHDVFPDSADGGQAPFRVWQRALAEGFVETAACGSLRIVTRPPGARVTPG
ncbi:MAG: class I SAM-dependent methyltransferase [Candidatus Dormibacteria bacterium]